MLGATTSNANSAATPSDLKTFNCSLCAIKFESYMAQRVHAREDWHVQNLKRRMAGQAALSKSEFERATSKSEAETVIQSRPRSICILCKLDFADRNEWQAHFQEQHGKQDASEHVTAPKEQDRCSNAKNDEFDPSQCLFCNGSSPDIESNLKHMSQFHSFFIPNSEYLADTESFLSYLYSVISVFHECLLCGASKYSTSAIQEHMRMKGHCALDFENVKLGIEEFYDFETAEDGSSWDDTDEDEDEIVVRQRVTNLERKAALQSLFQQPPPERTVGGRARKKHVRRKVDQRLVMAEAPEHVSTVDEQSETQTTRSSAAERRIMTRPGTMSSLIGVPEQKIRSLMAMEKKTVEAEKRGKKEYEARVERGANQQKRFKVKSIGKKQGGLEKRLG